MKKNTLKYVKYPSFHELIGVPLFTVKAIKRLIKKEKIEDSLSIIIEKSRQKANEMSEKEHSESNVALLEDDFTAFDDLFAKNFKSKQATKMCFEERIKYCLEKYREQSRNLSSATNSLILEENFLKGAQRILPLYFFFQNSGISVYSEENKVPVYQIHNNLKIEQNITNHLTKNVDNSITNYKIEQNNFTQNVDNSVINNQNTYHIKKDRNTEISDNDVEPVGLSSIMDEKIVEKLKQFFELRHISAKHKGLNVRKATFIRLHKLLQDEKFIEPSILQKTVIQAMINEYGCKFDPAVYSRADVVKIEQDEEDLRRDMLEYLRK